MTTSVTIQSRVYDLAMHGLNPFEVQHAIGLTDAEMAAAEVVEALQRGKAEGLAAVSKVLYGAAAGGVAGAAKFYLERNTEKETVAQPVVHDPNARTDEMILAHVDWVWRKGVAMLDGRDFDEPEPD